MKINKKQIIKSKVRHFYNAMILCFMEQIEKYKTLCWVTMRLS